MEHIFGEVRQYDNLLSKTQLATIYFTNLEFGTRMGCMAPSMNDGKLVRHGDVQRNVISEP